MNYTLLGYVFLLGRILYGGFFLYSGIKHFIHRKSMAQYATMNKVPMPMVAVLGSGVLIILGGIGVIVGFYVQIALLCIMLFLIPVTFSMHKFWKDTDPHAKMTNRIQFEKNLALLGAAIMIFTLTL